MRLQFREITEPVFLSGPKRIDVLLKELKQEEAEASDEDWFVRKPSKHFPRGIVALPLFPWPTLPWELHELSATLMESEQLLALEDDWDGEGATALERTLWERATNFLASGALWLWEKHHKILAVPSISIGPNGSIDIHWKHRSVELLINFPATENEPANFYGDNYGSDKVKGTFDLTGDNHWIVLWLTERM